jgi:hypothetical protein
VQLIEAVHSGNQNLIVVATVPGPIISEGWKNKAKAILVNFMPG